MLHFAGHGRAHSGVSEGGIEMEDDIVSITDVHQDRVVLGKQQGTVIVLNACETSAGARLLGMNAGWGAAIADREFGGLIAPLWEVQDEAALSMMQSALPCLLDGTRTLGEALKGARLATSGTSVAAYAYLAHGDVMARFAPRP
jgi:CHAT domain-containing protein